MAASSSIHPSLRSSARNSAAPRLSLAAATSFSFARRRLHLPSLSSDRFSAPAPVSARTRTAISGSASPVMEDATEKETLMKVFDKAIECRMDRRCTFVALGGGVIGDMCGFAAAAFLRGVNFIQIPTTLMAQVDSSVGGKTGVNHPLGKNLIGAFYQPQCVLIDTDTLNTLPDRELASGIGEAVKYGLIRDKEFFEWQEKNMQALLAR
ncbi:hypothetical protein B296_00003856 [Ensete ventricosum]|uniref:3-dehydroquinate synthase N-terminal domain-containing protein n=1 Tax=Ensete ventricosum TaxID=4639 RepID=A0A427B589_ENSVE|nr:hypothetical protein B296_00003856 [Ensete ventricosum]